jgi:hypothetical protein
MIVQEVLGGGAEQQVTKPKPQRPNPNRRIRPVVKKPSISFAKQSKYIKNTIPDEAFTFDSATDMLKETKDIKVIDKDLRLRASPVSTGKMSKEQMTRTLSLSQLLGEDRGELEKGILYYEILGKPISLRDSHSLLFD